MCRTRGPLPLFPGLSVTSQLLTLCTSALQGSVKNIPENVLEGKRGLNLPAWTHRAVHFCQRTCEVEASKIIFHAGLDMSFELCHLLLICSYQASPLSQGMDT